MAKTNDAGSAAGQIAEKSLKAVLGS